MPAGDQRVPLQPPKAHWDKVGEYQVPGSTLVGPGVVKGHVRRCYAHSPTGAVFAAYNYGPLADVYSTDPTVLRQITARSALRDEMLRQGGSPRSDPNTSAAIVGFRVVDYSPQEATIEVALHVAPKPSAEGDLGQVRSQLVSLVLRFLWQDGDWKAAAGTDGFQAEHLDSIAGLVVWGAP